MINIFLSIKKRKMIKIVSFIFIFLVAFSLVGCTKISNIFEEKEIIYESEDKKVRLEVAFRTSKIGKIYINKEGVEKAFVVSYINEKQINVYIKPPLLEESYLELDVSFETNMKNMKLKRSTYSAESNEFFDNFNVKLFRNNKKKINPLSYMNNKWKSKYPKIELNNDDLNNFYLGMINCKFEDEEAFLSFEESNLFIISNYNLGYKLTGNYEFDGLNMILRPHDFYNEYPKKIILEFSE